MAPCVRFYYVEPFGLKDGQASWSAKIAGANLRLYSAKRRGLPPPPKSCNLHSANPNNPQGWLKLPATLKNKKGNLMALPKYDELYFEVLAFLNLNGPTPWRLDLPVAGIFNLKNL
jgi:hypothetical protein